MLLCGVLHAEVFQREWRNFPVVSNYPANYPHTNPVPNFNRVYRVSSTGEKELITEFCPPVFSFETTRTNLPLTLTVNGESVVGVPINTSATTFILEAIQPIWITNAHWQYYYWVAAIDGTSPSVEVDMISFPWITWNIPTGHFLIEWTNDFVLWYPIEAVAGPLVKIIDIDVRIPHRFYRLKPI